MRIFPTLAEAKWCISNLCFVTGVGMFPVQPASSNYLRNLRNPNCHLAYVLHAVFPL